MPLQQTSGNVTSDAYGGGVAVVPNYIEDVFSTWLYTGNGSTQTITNGIDLSTNGGLVWIKQRNFSQIHVLVDTVRGNNKRLQSNSTAAEDTTSSLMSFNSDGFSVPNNYGITNSSDQTYVSWTFREQPKFFDVVTYTGNGTNPRNISHNLGSAPGCIIVKRTDTTSPWAVYHRGVSPINNNTLALQSTAAASDGGQDLWGNGATVVVPTSTVFTVSNSLNTNGATYVAYLWAHDAGGFGLTGTDNVISCGSFTGSATVNLGYEPQWILVKTVNSNGNWILLDTMRGWNNSVSDATINANTSGAEYTSEWGNPTATGFFYDGTGGIDYIYIAIRRGPMKVPTDATKVFEPVAFTGNNTSNTSRGTVVTTDLAIISDTNNVAPQNIYNQAFFDRLRGSGVNLTSSNTGGEVSGWGGSYFALDQQKGWRNLSDTTYLNNSAINYVTYNFQRAPSFFDEVCYTGTGANTTQTHNLGVVPELMIVKQRGPNNRGWQVYQSFVGPTKFLSLQTSDAANTSSFRWNDTAPTATVFSIGDATPVNESGSTFVAYLFATCAGVSKVGNYTGNGATQTINCGFAGGARFVLIKRTDDFGDWYVYDTARGMTTLTDPYLLLNSTAAESATLGSVTTVTTGFAVNASILAAINTNGASYIYLSIA